MKILHVGATGLVGQLVLARLLESPGVARVVAPTRRPLALRHPVLENPVVDFDALPADAPWGRWMPRSARWAPRWRSPVRVTPSGGWTTTIRWRWRGWRVGRAPGLSC